MDSKIITTESSRICQISFAGQLSQIISIFVSANLSEFKFLTLTYFSLFRKLKRFLFSVFPKSSFSKFTIQQGGTLPPVLITEVCHNQSHPSGK